MDTVRFGRVLGLGARHAAKTLLTAADAATAPNPRASRPASPASTPAPSHAPVTPRPSIAGTPDPPAASRAVASDSGTDVTGTLIPPPRPAAHRPSANATAQAVTTARGVAEGSRRFGRAVWAPAVRLSGVLWLELTGVFFALFALVAGIAAWKLRSAVGIAATASAASEDRTRFFFALGMMLVFSYFSLSSFLKARRRSRRL